jgi:capsular polysaccharide transport system permease protein
MAAGTFPIAFRNWRTVIAFLMTQYFNNRFKGTKLSVFIALFEPLIMICTFYFLKPFLRIHLPEYGTSPLLFFASGVLPFYLFMKTSRAARRNSGRGSSVPRIQDLDYLVSGALVEALTVVVMLGLVFVAIYYLGGVEQARPRNIETCLAACFTLAIMGLGVGLINSYISAYVPAWGRFYRVAARIAFMSLSGLFFIVALMPYYIRSIVVWNPLAHGIEWFRVGLYGPQYPHVTLDIEYPMKVAPVALVIGFLLYQSLKRRYR